MSNAPSGFQTPKTNWQTADVVQPSDLNRIEGNINAIEQGARTLNQAQAPSGNEGSLRQILSWLANRIRAITGMTNWYDAPPTTLTATKAHIDATGTSAHGGSVAAIGNTLAVRDAQGRLKAAAPVAADDVVRKAELDAIPVVAYGPGDTILAEALGVRSTRAYYQEPETLRTFVSPLPGTYRITFEGWINDSSGLMRAELYVNETRVASRSTWYTSPEPFSCDVGPVYSGDRISLKVGQSDPEGHYRAYIRNFRVRGVSAPPPFVIT